MMIMVKMVLGLTSGKLKDRECLFVNHDGSKECRLRFLFHLFQQWLHMINMASGGSAPVSSTYSSKMEVFNKFSTFS